jgi:hypothetical protein
MNRKQPLNTKGSDNKVLNPTQEESLKAYLDWLIYLGHQAHKGYIRKATNSILRASGSDKKLDKQ